MNYTDDFNNELIMQKIKLADHFDNELIMQKIKISDLFYNELIMKMIHTTNQSTYVFHIPPIMSSLSE
jgi:hypothetical protein